MISETRVAKEKEKGFWASINWSTLWRTEDWWACWIGFLIILAATARILPAYPRARVWMELGWGAIFPDGFLLSTLVVFLIIMGVSSGGLLMMKRFKITFIPAFALIFALATLALVMGRLNTMALWRVENSFVFWAIVIGLLISNIMRVPEWLKSGIFTEYYIKVGLVIFGVLILFSDIVRGGLIGFVQGAMVIAGVWFVAYWIGIKFGGMSKEFAGIMASGVSICGVSASIAAGGALKGNPKDVAYVIAWIMICAVVMIFIMPPLAVALGLPANMAGAWIGGTIDNTAAVVAASAMHGPHAATVGLIVKLSQNVLIGMAAFLMAVWATLVLSRAPGAKRPPFIEVWWRFPKFVVGFLVASLFIFVVLEPIMGVREAGVIARFIGHYRDPFWALAFVCIGLETNFRALAAVGGGKPAIVYWVSQIWNVIWTLAVVWVLWSGWLFAPPL